MITLEDCLAFCGLTEEEVLAIAEHEHMPEIAAVRGHTANIDFSFWDIFDSGSSGAELELLAALMGYMEARKGEWSI